MATELPNYYGQASLGDPTVGTVGIQVNSLLNSVLTSEPFVFNVAEQTAPITKSYQIIFQNSELGPVVDTTGTYRNAIQTIYHPPQYRYLVVDSTGSAFPVQVGGRLISGSNYCNSNIVNIRFVSGSLSGSNLSISASIATGSQDILVTNITKSVDNTNINSLKSGSNFYRRSDGIVNNTFYNGDYYYPETSIQVIGSFERTILRGSETTIITETDDFISKTAKPLIFEADYYYLFSQEIDSVLTIETAIDLPQGFSISPTGRSIVGFVNFTSQKTFTVKLTNGDVYNIIIKPIFAKRKYIY